MKARSDMQHEVRGGGETKMSSAALVGRATSSMPEQRKHVFEARRQRAYDVIEARGQREYIACREQVK